MQKSNYWFCVVDFNLWEEILLPRVVGLILMFMYDWVQAY